MTKNSTATRRKRLRSSTRVIGLNPRPSDDEILFHLDYLRAVRTSSLCMLTGRSRKSLNRRLPQLADARLINYVDPKKESDASFNPEAVFALGNKGADRVAKLRGVPRTSVNWTDLNREFKQLDHALLISDFMARVEAACNASGGEFRLLKDDEILARASEKRRRSRDPFLIRAPIDIRGVERSETTRPDKLFALEFANQPRGGNRYYFLLEADRSTMSQRRERRTDLRSIYKKFQVYYSWQVKNLCERDFGIQRFRVLFLTGKSERRFRYMIARNEDIRDGGWIQFMFAFKKDLFATANILTAPWINGIGEPVSLID